jgi:hypothetical protein
VLKMMFVLLVASTVALSGCAKRSMPTVASAPAAVAPPAPMASAPPRPTLAHGGAPQDRCGMPKCYFEKLPGVGRSAVLAILDDRMMSSASRLVATHLSALAAIRGQEGAA